MKQLLTPLDRKKPFLQGLILFVFSCLIAIGTFVPIANATGVYDLPALGAGSSTWVVDRADAISSANEGKLNKDLKQLAQKTGNEVRMVVIRRLDFDETIDSFADELFDRWYPTSEDKANQTLLVIDTLTNQTAIRTGDTTSQKLTDDIAQSVVAQTVAVPLKDGAKYNQALLDANNRLSAVLSGEPDPGPPTVQEINIDSTFTSAEETNDRSATIWVVVILVLATVIPMVTYFWYVGFPGR